MGLTMAIPVLSNMLKTKSQEWLQTQGPDYLIFMFGVSELDMLHVLQQITPKTSNRLNH